jgi:hypothetical protein
MSFRLQRQRGLELCQAARCPGLGQVWFSVHVGSCSWLDYALDRAKQADGAATRHPLPLGWQATGGEAPSSGGIFLACGRILPA